MKFLKALFGVKYTMPLESWNKLVDEKLALKAKLKAAAEALRVIECRTDNNGYVSLGEIITIHEIAQNAWRATQ